MYATGGGGLLSSFFAAHVPVEEEAEEAARLLDELSHLVIFGCVKVHAGSHACVEAAPQ